MNGPLELPKAFADLPFDRLDKIRLRLAEPSGLYSAVICGARTASVITIPVEPGIGALPNTSRQTDDVALLLIAGRGKTGDDGTTTVKLTETGNGTEGWTTIPIDGCDTNYAGPGALVIERDPVVQMTLRSNAARFGTAVPKTAYQAQRLASAQHPINQRYRDLITGQQLNGIGRHYDLSITFQTWNHSGDPAPDTSFWWCCSVAGVGLSFDA